MMPARPSRNRERRFPVASMSTSITSSFFSIRMLTNTMWKTATAIYCFVILFSFRQSSGASNNYNAYQYDMTGAQFTPDGRLLQVEYASAAADHSSPIVAVPITPDLCLICTTNRQGVFTERLILVPTGSLAMTTTQRQENEKMVVLALSGILADNMALLETVQEKRLEQLQLYETPLSTQQVAQTIADECQKKAFGGGIRPFGATLLVCGTDRMYQTDPSGAMLETSYENLLQEESSRKSVVVGGTANSARALERQIAALCREDADTDNDIRRRMKKILLLVLREQQKMAEKEELELEAALISKSRGVLKLTKRQISVLLEEHEE